MVARLKGFFLRQCWLTTLTVVVFLLFTAYTTMADDLVRPVELSVSGGFADGPGFAAKAPTAGAGIEVGPRFLRVTASGGWLGLRKLQTPGGRQLGGTVGGKIYINRFFAVGGFSHNYTDQGVWTKTVQYAYGGAGLRWAGNTYNENGAPQWINQFAFTYWRETYSTYANDTTILRASFTASRRIGTSPWYVRGSASLSGMYYNDNPYPGAERRQGLGISAKLGLAFMP